MDKDQAGPMGWKARELAGNTTPVVIPDAEKTGATRRSTMYHEIVLIDPHDGQPARLAITNQYTGHTEAWDLPRGLRLTVAETGD